MGTMIVVHSQYPEGRSMVSMAFHGNDGELVSSRPIGFEASQRVLSFVLYARLSGVPQGCVVTVEMEGPSMRFYENGSCVRDVPLTFDADETWMRDLIVAELKASAE